MFKYHQEDYKLNVIKEYLENYFDMRKTCKIFKDSYIIIYIK